MISSCTKSVAELEEDRTKKTHHALNGQDRTGQDWQAVALTDDSGTDDIITAFPPEPQGT